MEFKITKKANLFTIVLMIVGLLFTGIGIAFEMGHDHGHHLGQRLAGNLLVNSFLSLVHLQLLLQLLVWLYSKEFFVHLEQSTPLQEQRP